MSPTSPIVVLDSGLGGLTVVRALRQVLPGEHILYFGDMARLPYGSKSAATVTLFVRQIIAYLRPRGPKHVVIACNTATALALPTIRKEFPDLSISGVVEPGAQAAAEALQRGGGRVVGVIATEATVRSGAYERALAKRMPDCRVMQRATPLLVPIIEEGRGPDDPVVRLAVEEYLRPLREAGMQVLVLGCTHYPLLKGLICDRAGGAGVIDSADQCAQDVRRRLEALRLVRGGGGAPLECYVTDDSPRFADLAGRFLGWSVGAPVWVSPEELHGLVEARGDLRAVV